MTQYDISLIGTSWRLMLLSCDESPPPIISPQDAYILPDHNHDVRIVPGPTLCRDSWLLGLLLSYFYSAVLGYPECTLEVFCDAPFELEIFDTPPGVASLRIPKCKGLFTNAVTLSDGTTHTLYTALCERVVRVISASNRDCFCPDLLSGLLLLDGLPDAREAVALSGGHILLPTGAHLSASVIAAATAVFDGRPAILRYGECTLTVEDAEDFLILSTRADLLSKKII